MQPDQVARRLYYRLRRAVLGRAADHEPLVEIEGAPPARQTGARVRHLAGHWLRSSAAFLATLAVFAALYGVSAAWRARVTLPGATPEIAAPENGSKAVAAAAMLLALPSIDPAREAWFTPEARKRRAAFVQQGAGEAVDAFVEVVERRRAGNDKDLALAVAALTDESGGPGGHYAAARDALRRFNTRAARKRQPLDRGAPALAALARAAAASVESHAHALREAAQETGAGAIRGPAEDEFYRARGCAYAWGIILGAYGEDMHAAATPALSAMIAGARGPLAAAGAYEPFFLRTPPIGDANPLRELAGKMTAGALAVRALAEGADPADGR